MDVKEYICIIQDIQIHHPQNHVPECVARKNHACEVFVSATSKGGTTGIDMVHADVCMGRTNLYLRLARNVNFD